MKNLFAWKVSLQCRDEDEVCIPNTRLIIFEVCLDYKEEVCFLIFVHKTLSTKKSRPHSWTTQKSLSSYLIVDTNIILAAETNKDQTHHVEYSQVVRHRFLVPTCEGSIPSTPAFFMFHIFLAVYSLKL